MKLHKLSDATRCPSCNEPQLAFVHEEPTGDLYFCMGCEIRVHHEIYMVMHNGHPTSGCRLVTDNLSSIRFDADCIDGQATSDPPRCA